MSAQKTLEANRKLGIGRLIRLVRQDFLLRMERLTASQFDKSILLSCGTLMPLIDLEGTRSKEIARRLNVSKQTVMRSIKALIDHAFVECVDDPSDGRAYLVKFTPLGLERMAQIHAAVHQIEAEYDALVGRERMDVVRQVLKEIAYPERPPRARRTAPAPTP